MEKLIELFNEYERPQTNHIYTAYEVKENMNRLDILQEFIKWLVDNDKIDIVKWIKYGLKDGRDIENYKYDKNKSRKNRVRYWTEYLLMTLSIQDKPIEFLCSILK